MQYFKKHHNLLIGSRTAERIKCEIGSAQKLDPELELSVKGRDLVTGVPKVRVVSSEDVREALRPSALTRSPRPSSARSSGRRRSSAATSWSAGSC